MLIMVEKITPSLTRCILCGANKNDKIEIKIVELVIDRTMLDSD